MPTYEYNLISFELCPYVQRSVIALEEKGVPYTVEHIDPEHKPQWFLDISPLGKVPVLRVNREHVIFESAVICELIEETAPGAPLHPADPLARAHDRAWIEVASDLLRRMFSMVNAHDEATGRTAVAAVRTLLGRFESELRGPLFTGESFCLVDAAAAPALQRLGWCDELRDDLELFGDLERVRAWRDFLLARPGVQRSTVPEIRELFLDHLGRRGSWLTER